MINNLISILPPLQCWLRRVRNLHIYSALCHRWTIEHNFLDSMPMANIVQGNQGGGDFVYFIDFLYM
jgi:hypothetical protein